ncbi:MAG: type I DNA topoisomerase [Candidatus Muiribacteriota bacterium]
MAKKTILIVESPGKIKTLEKILGKNYTVKASKGHVRDLPESKFGIEIKNNHFEPQYQVMKDKKKTVEELKSFKDKGYDFLFAPDPDREGEAIAWHLLKILDVSEKKKCRVVFNAITPSEVLKGIENPDKINIYKVNAQQSRRILDRIVGYKLSPFLWRKVDKGLSAGRVQTVALLIIVDREIEIEAFKPEEYFVFTADFLVSKINLKNTKLTEIDGKKLAKIKLDTKKAEEIKKSIKEKEKDFYIENITNKTRTASSPPPFITSTLQQEASRVYGFTAKKTMMIAQSLYEGKQIGKETYGLITYMRTDSIRVSKEGEDMAVKYVLDKFGKEYLGGQKVSKKGSKSKVQDAHEAIRPSYIDSNFEPEKIGKFLSPDEKKLYTLIWNRLIASFMKPALYDVEDIDITEGVHKFNIKFEKIKFPGYQKVYRGEEDEIDEKDIVKLTKGEKALLEKIEFEAKMTQPPPRYTEATLIKTLEKEGIGRPSTYATIINTILNRKYVEREKKNLMPTDLGIVVSYMMSTVFDKIINIKFTADLEKKLDDIEAGEVDFQKVLADFYGDFDNVLEEAKKQVSKISITTDIKCDKCSSEMTLKFHRQNEFLACPKFPDCSNTISLPQGIRYIPADFNEKTVIKLQHKMGELKALNEEARKSIESDVLCEKCGAKMVVKTGRFGTFLACPNYPKCKNTKPINQEMDIDCPDCGKGKVVIKKSKRGKRFYACSKYPDCKYTSFDIPTEEKCPDCESTMFKKTAKDEDVYCKKCKKDDKN